MKFSPLYFIIILMFLGCSKDYFDPKIITKNVTDYTSNSAKFSAEIVDEKGYEIIKKGFVYSTSPQQETASSALNNIYKG